jgi:hypothetical protein
MPKKRVVKTQLQSISVTTTQPKDWHKLFKQSAKLSKKSYSEWVGDTLLKEAAKLQGVSVSELRKTLSPRIRRGERV